MPTCSKSATVGIFLGHLTFGLPPHRSENMIWLDELKRRHIGRVFLAYAAAAFVVLQAADVVIPALDLPESALRIVMALVILGFPVAMAVAWAYDITPHGLERTAPLDEETSAGEEPEAKVSLLCSG